MATTKTLEYATFSALTATGWNSFASDTNLLAGYALAEVDNSTNKYFDYIVTSEVKTGTTPTVGRIELWVIPEKTDSAYFESLAGTAGTYTATSRDILFSEGGQLGSVVNTTTSNVVYTVWGSVVRALRGAPCPRKFQIWMVHSTVAALNASGHACGVKGVFSKDT